MGTHTFVSPSARASESPQSRRDWPLRFYSRERLFSKETRLGWLEPDLVALSHSREAMSNVHNGAESGHEPKRVRSARADKDGDIDDFLQWPGDLPEEALAPIALSTASSR
jgi:hypothetical protein